METSFGSRVKQFRQHKALSQQAFAEQSGLTQGNIAHMEGGTEPKQSNLAKLVAGFPDLNPDWLLLGAGTMLRDGRSLAPAARPVAAPAAADYGADLVAQAENVLLREHLAAATAQQLADRETIQWLRVELGKSSGSADATGRFAPTAPRPVIGGFQTNQQQAAAAATAAASAMLTASFRGRHNKRSGGVTK